MTDEYVLMYINDDDDNSPLFLRGPGDGLTCKISEAEHLPRKEAEKAVKVMDANMDDPRVAGGCFAVPKAYRADNDDRKENKA